jgi:AraC-like DNA-binding protein
MPSARRVTGAWAQLLSDWLDREKLAAPDIRAALSRFAPDDVVPVAVWSDLLARAAALRPDRRSIGLEIGSGVQPRHVGVLGYLVLASATLGDAMLAYQRYERLFYGVDIAEVEAMSTPQGPMVEIRWENAGLSSTADELAIAALVTFLRRQVDNPPPPARIAFMHRVSTEVAADYECFFGCPVFFGDSHVRVRFPAGYLAMPMPRSDPALRVLLDRQAQALLAALPESAGFDRALQQMLLRLLPEGEASLERLAKELHQSPRTLQRRLAAGGLSWQQLLDRTREQLARQYLADRSLSMSDIALLLGYTEQSALTRAVKRWTGKSPRQLRA